MMFECPVCGHKKSIPQTNAERIRDMIDGELAEFLGDLAQRHRAWMCDSQGECLVWLQEPTKDGEGDDRQRKAD